MRRLAWLLVGKQITRRAAASKLAGVIRVKETK
jgi:hypothetical protein